MAKVKYLWGNNSLPKLDLHSEGKLKVLRDYMVDYIKIRCRNYFMPKFKLVIVDGFSGGGFYQNPISKIKEPGSPIIFIRSLVDAINQINQKRPQNKLRIECTLVMNDAKKAAIEQLREFCDQEIKQVYSEIPELKIVSIYINKEFIEAYSEIKEIIRNGRFTNCVINLDQYGYVHVPSKYLIELIDISNSVEIFYTFMIEPLVSFMEKNNRERLMKQLRTLDVSYEDIKNLQEGLKNDEWRGFAEQFVFKNFKSISKFITPFSINNPKGWKYWLIHFSKKIDAREAYNSILHKHDTSVLHFGERGLDMLEYDPKYLGQQYLFTEQDKELNFQHLLEDLPRKLCEYEGGTIVGTFLENNYNQTVAPRESICEALLKSKDIKLVTQENGYRRSANAIKNTDRIVCNLQKFFIFGK